MKKINQRTMGKKKSKKKALKHRIKKNPVKRITRGKR
jgi:hypothetical protein